MGDVDGDGDTDILAASRFGNEVAWCLENHILTQSGESRVGYSIETYRFEPDGSVVIRTYYRVPTHTDRDLGEHYQEYLPDEG